jgi:hypothetical protein
MVESSRLGGFGLFGAAGKAFYHAPGSERQFGAWRGFANPA